MNGILNIIGFRKRIHVGISVSANNFIELVCVDRKTKSVVRYASGNIKYNNAIREIIDMDDFRNAVDQLFRDAELNPEECIVTLNLPNVFFHVQQCEENIAESTFYQEIDDIIQDLYIFKRNEPSKSVKILKKTFGRTTRPAIASAIQNKAAIEITSIFEDLGAELIRIDTSYSTMLKTLQFCSRFEQYLKPSERTEIILVTPNSCCAFYLDENILVDFKEELLAVKSFSTEEVYGAINKIAGDAIRENKPKSLFIISETDEVNAEMVAKNINFDGTTDYLNKSLNANEKFIDIEEGSGYIDSSMIPYITIEAVGAAVSDYDDYPVDLNVIPGEKSLKRNVIEMGEYEVPFVNFAAAVIFTAVIAGLAVGGIGMVVLNSLSSNQGKDNNDIIEKNEVFRRKIDKNKANQTNNIFPVLTQITETNNNIANVYVGLAEDIPNSIYIKKFVTNEKGGIGILGEAKTSEDVQAFVKKLREKNQDLMVSKLSVNSPEDINPAKIPNGFTFEIKTSQTDVNIYENIDLIKDTMQNALNGDNNTNNAGGSLTPPPAPVI